MKGIKMNAQSVLGILNNQKTQIRRPIKSMPLEITKWGGWCWTDQSEMHAYWETKNDFFCAKPKFTIGETIFVKEAFANVMGGPPLGFTVYRADKETITVETPSGIREKTPNWKSDASMTEKDARFLLEITGVKVQRVQDITEEEAINEGIEKDLDGWKDHTKRFANHPEYPAFGGMFREILPTAINSYKKLWDSIYGKKHPWESNPWVFVYTFKRVKEATDGK